MRPREADVREIYQTADVERKRYLLRQYDVRYVVVGDVERYSIVGDLPQDGEPEYYSSTEGLEAFDRMVGDDVEVAFESHGTTIYRVLPFPDAGRTR